MQQKFAPLHRHASQYGWAALASLRWPPSAGLLALARGPFAGARCSSSCPIALHRWTSPHPRCPALSPCNGNIASCRRQRRLIGRRCETSRPRSCAPFSRLQAAGCITPTRRRIDHLLSRRNMSFEKQASVLTAWCLIVIHLGETADPDFVAESTPERKVAHPTLYIYVCMYVGCVRKNHITLDVQPYILT